jgi:hypothetical protein
MVLGSETTGQGNLELLMFHSSLGGVLIAPNSRKRLLYKQVTLERRCQILKVDTINRKLHIEMCIRIAIPKQD